MIESGLISQWSEEVVYEVEEIETTTTKKNEDSRNLSILNLQAPFLVFLIGNLLSGLTLLVEIVYYKFENKKRHV